ncbi:hypothetical protein [Planctomyces sp. SH-PL14]|uniref:hypothetical protein n=1 Tax=Planctomyces sp. SH-PL14 TaxID=1632864 RepID=UPI00078B68B6|nr:hypothetical protein [Planctomyces sp. SH-PL14]AMV18344.1 hypothetical protein VT03_10670 [Planctomyces sp. SH-PL14]
MAGTISTWVTVVRGTVTRVTVTTIRTAADTGIDTIALITITMMRPGSRDARSFRIMTLTPCSSAISRLAAP